MTDDDAMTDMQRFDATVAEWARQRAADAAAWAAMVEWVATDLPAPVTP